MVLRSSKYGLFYGCTDFPRCKAAHGAHEDGRPLGVPANKQTKRARIRAHEVFDQLWKDRHMSRSEAYSWMQKAMGLSEGDAHIGRFTEDQCDELETKVEEHLESLTTEDWMASLRGKWR
jgi:ssDNA-binding Zn-finger/Zn-ribbon topoisomerase 1